MIERPAGEVFAWRRERLESRRTSEGPLGAGSTFPLLGRALGRRIEARYELVEHEPNRTAAWKTLSGPLPLVFRRSFETSLREVLLARQVADGTR